jgi:ribosomal protein S18 acetylase RimI-like enzyme
MWRLIFQVSREGRNRFYKEFLPLLHDTKHQVLGDRDDKSWYLVYLGTKPSARGKGYAGKLLQHGLALADKDGLPTYLESSAASNIPYYEKFGFEFVKEIRLLRSEKPLTLSIMTREPGAGKVVSPASTSTESGVSEVRK